MDRYKKGYSIAIVSFAGLILAGLFTLGWMMSSNIMHPTYTCNEEHFIYCDDPLQLGLSFEDISFQSSDGNLLNGWYMPAKDSDKVIIFVHGHGADRREGMRWFSAVHQAGFNILTFDLRNSGENIRSFSSMGYFEQRDVEAAVDYVQQLEGNQRIGIFGTSMGAATSIMAMAKDPRIEAGVFEAGWSNLRDLYKEIIEQYLKIPSFPLLPVTSWILELRTGMDMDQVNPEQLLGQIAPRPVFIIHCTGDKLIGFSHGERNYAAANEPKQFWKSPCETHARAWQSDPEYIEQLVVEYYLQHL
ncbi:MAG: alpha/beta fold hydrolase [Porticoccaceae bacterium]|jgi:dipeptidyl aminopeptidase/acylaminoacyl peptidase|nr:alpha/beta fold hydrolase [Porticoccaceae bacterium]MBT7374399.1 alpha/beta fold hydrolase [Porticoccaceae bacterium]